MYEYLHTRASIEDALRMWEIRDVGMSWADAQVAAQQRSARRAKP